MKRQKLIKTRHQKRKPRLKHLNNNMTNIFSLPTTYKQPQSRFSSKLFVLINSILALFPLCYQKYAHYKHTQTQDCSLVITSNITLLKVCKVKVTKPMHILKSKGQLKDKTIREASGTEEVLSISIQSTGERKSYHDREGFQNPTYKRSTK